MRLNSQISFLTVGIMLLAGGVISTCLGKTRAPKVPGTLRRADDPFQFWLAVAIYHVAGVFFIVVYLNQGN